MASTLGNIAGTSNAQRDAGQYPDVPCLLPERPPPPATGAKRRVWGATPPSQGWTRNPSTFSFLYPCLPLPTPASVWWDAVWGGQERKALKSRACKICSWKTCLPKARASRLKSLDTLVVLLAQAGASSGVCTEDSSRFDLFYM